MSRSPLVKATILPTRSDDEPPPLVDSDDTDLLPFPHRTTRETYPPVWHLPRQMQKEEGCVIEGDDDPPPPLLDSSDEEDLRTKKPTKTQNAPSSSVKQMAKAHAAIPKAEAPKPKPEPVKTTRSLAYAPAYQLVDPTKNELDSLRRSNASQEQQLKEQQQRLSVLEKRLAAEIEQVKSKDALLLDQANTIRKERAEKADLDKRLSGALAALAKRKEETAQLRQSFQQVEQDRAAAGRELGLKQQELDEARNSLQDQAIVLSQQAETIISLRKGVDAYESSCSKARKLAFITSLDPDRLPEATKEEILDMEEEAREYLSRIVTAMHLLASARSTIFLRGPPPESEDLVCVVCLHEEKSILLRPCNHVCLCKECSSNKEGISHCPICRERIESREPVFLS